MKRILAFFSLAFVLILASCFTDDADSNNPGDKPQPVEVALDSISLVDSEGETVTEVTEYQSNLAYQHSNVYVKAKYADDSVKDVTSQATFSEVSLANVGKVTVEVTYKEKKATYDVNVVENDETTISINTTKAKVIYHKGDVFSTEGLVVQVKYKNGLVETVTKYTTAITDMKNRAVDQTKPFDTTGEYKVKVTVGKASNVYLIAVATEEFATMSTWNASVYAENMAFSAEGKASLTGKTELFKSTKISLTAEKTKFSNKNSDGSKMEPSYANKSFDKALEITASQDVKLVLEEDTELLFYVGGQTGRGLVFKQDGEEIYAIGNINGDTSYQYVSLEAGSYDILTNIDTIMVYAIVFGSETSPVVSNGLVAELGTTVYQGTETLDLTSLSVYKIEGTSKTLVSGYTTKLYLDDEEVTAFTETGFYTLEVSVNNDKAICSLVYFEEKITEDLEELIPEEIETQIYGNGVEFSLEKFIEATPLGYTLSGVLVKDKDGNVVQDIPYNGVMTNIAIGDLENDTEYLIQPYYDLALPATYSLQTRAAITPGYRIYFVGIHVITYGDVMYRVKLTYQGELLYTYILAEGGNLYVWNFNFMLPIKYEDYRCVGTEVGEAFNVTKDMEVEVILVKNGEETEFTVVFYGWNDGEILKIEKVAKGGDATPPSMDDIDEFRTINGGLYRCDGWDEYQYQNITSTTIVYMKRTFLPKLVVPQTDYTIEVTDTTIELSLGYVYSTSYSIVSSKTKKYMINPAGMKTEIVGNESLENLSPDTTYKFLYSIVYNLGSGEEVKEEEIEVTTLASDSDLNITTTVTNVTYRGATLTPSDSTIVAGYYYYNSDMLRYRFSISKYSKSISPSRLVQNTEYTFYYYTETLIANSEIRYFYKVPVVVQTLDATAPNIPTELYIRDVSSKGTFSSAEILYEWVPGDVEIFFQGISWVPEVAEIEHGWWHDWNVEDINSFSGYYDSYLDMYCAQYHALLGSQWIPDSSHPDGGYVVEYQCEPPKLAIGYFLDGEFKYVYFVPAYAETKKINGQSYFVYRQTDNPNAYPPFIY